MIPSPPYAPVDDPAPEPNAGANHDGFYDAPPELMESYWNWTRLDRDVASGRMRSRFRGLAARRDPINTLVSSVVLRLRAARAGRSLVEANAAADLAVTGRYAFDQFKAAPVTDDRLIDATRPTLTQPAPAGEPPLRDVSEPELRSAVSATLDRAYTVAWALTAGPYHRARLRPDLGWIAVSGEDDPPHSPVNIPATRDHVGRWVMEIPGVRQRFSIRMAIKVFGGTPEFEEAPAAPIRNLPARSQQFFHHIINRRHLYDELAIFIHGLGSRLEESDNFKKFLITQARSRGLHLGVLSLDLPGFGYSDHLDLDSLLRDRTRGHHGFVLPHGVGSSFPVLTLYRDILAELSRLIPGRVQFACGGSLGGNLTLCLAEAPSPIFTSLPLDRALGEFRRFASWSPASVWESYERARAVPGIGNRTYRSISKNGTRIRPQRRMHEDESTNRRANFFELMQLGEEILPGWRESAWGHPAVRANVLTQSELYSAQYRRCFWATAYEQAVLSHQERYADSRPRFLSINRPLLIAAGSLDRGGPTWVTPLDRTTNIYDNVALLTDSAPDVPGERHLMLNTNHSISDERPYRLAEKVAAFFAEGANLRQPEGLIVVPAVSGRHGADIWHMARDRVTGKWSRSAPIPGNALGASLDCDGDRGIGAKLAVAGDFDGDGRMEVAVVADVDASRGSPLWVMKRRSNGTWSHLNQISNHPVGASIECADARLPGLHLGIKFVVAGDFNGDGRDELVIAPAVADDSGRDMWSLRYRGGGSPWQHMSPIPGHAFGADLRLAPGFRGSRPFGARSAVAADVDGDGQDELVVVPDIQHTGGNDIWVMKFVSGEWRHFYPIHGHPFQASINCDAGAMSPGNFGVRFIVAGDFDGDGQDEIVVGPETGGTAGNDLWAMKFDRPSRSWRHMSPDMRHPFLADINCDRFSPVPSRFAAKFAISGDVDGDGQDELVVAPDAPGTEGNDLWVMKFDGTAWRNHFPIRRHPFSASINCDLVDRDPRLPAKFALLADIDGDGRDELIAAPEVSGSAGNDLWVLALVGGRWLNQGPDLRHPFLATIDCDKGIAGTVGFPARLAVSGQF